MPKVTTVGATASKKATAKPEAKKVVKKQPVQKESLEGVIYPEVAVKKYESQPLTADTAKRLLGWEGQPEGVEWSDHLFKDLHNVPIKCHNNTTNRPLKLRQVLTCQQEILRKRWALNGETIIISRTGRVLNGQHRLIGLVLAAQLWNHDKEKAPEWDAEPSIQTIVVVGISDDQAVQNTIDNVITRSLQDVLFLSPYFQDYGVGDRKTVAKMAAHAVKMLWARTGQSDSAFSPNRTHSESIDMIERHPRLLECIKHIYEINKKDNNLKDFLTPGYCSAVMYLMATSATNPTDYYKKTYPSEVDLDFSMWDKAEEFFTLLLAGDKLFSDVRTVYADVATHNEDVDHQGLGGSMDERIAIMLHAWEQFREDRPMSKSKIELSYVVDKNGVKTLNSFPTAGGIDRGDENPAILLADDGETATAPSFAEGAGGAKIIPGIPNSRWKKDGSLVLNRLYWGKNGMDWEQGYLQEVAGRAATLSMSGQTWKCDVQLLSIEKPKGL